MIEIKNNSNAVVIEPLEGEEKYIALVKLNSGDIVVAPNTTRRFHTGVDINCSEFKEEVYVEMSVFDKNGCFADDVTFNNIGDKELIINIENYTPRDVIIKNGTRLATLYKYFKYDESQAYNIVYEANDIVVGEKDASCNYKADNVEVTLHEDKKTVTLDIIPIQ